MGITNLSLGQGFVIFLVMAKLKRSIGIMILSLIIFVSLAMLSFRNTTLLLSSLTSVPPYLPLVLDLFPDEAHIPSVASSDSPIDLSVQPLDILDPFPCSPFNEQVDDELPNPKLRSPAPALLEDLAQDIPPHHSAQVRSIPTHLLDYHCYTALATLHKPYTYYEASTDPL